MTEVGRGGVVIRHIRPDSGFTKDYAKLDPQLKQRLKKKLKDLLKAPMPPGLRFEKLKGHHNPDIYTFYVTGNYKVSLEIRGDLAILRRVACHDEIDRKP